MSIGQVIQQIVETENIHDAILIQLFQLVAQPQLNSLGASLPAIDSDIESFCQGISLHFEDKSQEAIESIRNLLNNNPPSWLVDYLNVSLLGMLWSQGAYQQFMKMFIATDLPKELEMEIAIFMREQLTKKGEKKPDEQALFQKAAKAYQDIDDWDDDLENVPADIADFLAPDYNKKLNRFNNALIREFLADPTKLRLFGLFVNVNANDYLSYGMLAKHIAKKPAPLQVPALVNLFKYRGESDAYKILISILPNQLIGAMGNQTHFNSFNQFFTLIQPLNLNCERALLEAYLWCANFKEITLDPTIIQKLTTRIETLPEPMNVENKSFKAACRCIIDSTDGNLDIFSGSEVVSALHTEFRVLQAANSEWAEIFLNERLAELNLTILAQINHLWLDLELIRSMIFDEAKDSFLVLTEALALRGHLYIVQGKYADAERDLIFASEKGVFDERDTWYPLLAALGYVHALKGDFDKAYDYFDQVFNNQGGHDTDSVSKEYLMLSYNLKPDLQDQSSPWYGLYTKATAPESFTTKLTR